MNRRILALLLLPVVAFGVLAMAQAKKASGARTFRGVISDDMCGAGKHIMTPGKTDAECVRACVKAGAKFALVAPDGHLYILHGKSPELDQLAARKVKITGKLDGNTIEVVSVEAEQ